MKALLLGVALLTLAVGNAFATDLPQAPTPDEHRLYVLVGDKDNFHPGDAADVARLSPACEEILRRCTEWGNLGEAAALDERRFDRAVALTLFADIPQDAHITTAILKFRFLGTAPLVQNDHFRMTHDPFPVVALKDVLGFEPTMGRAHVATLNLMRVPVRTELGVSDTRWIGGPDGFRSFLPLLRKNGCLDVVLMDDLAVDYAELIVEYSADPGSAGSGGPRIPEFVCSPIPGTDGFCFAFAMPQAATVQLQIFDVAGRKVADVVSGAVPAGKNEITWDGSTLVPGVYFARLQSGGAMRTAKLIRMNR